MRLRVILLSLLLVSGCSPARWSAGDTLRQSGLVALTLADWRQTVAIVRDCDEVNPVIGACGDAIRPAAYFPAVLLLHLGIAVLLPPGWVRETWQLVPLGAELNQVWANWTDGVSPL